MKIIGFILCLTMLSITSAMDDKKECVFGRNVKMPNAQVLSQNLHEYSFDHFNKITHIADKLANREKFIAGIVIAVQTAYCDYSRYLQEHMDPKLLEQAAEAIAARKPEMYEALLKQNAKALDELKEFLKNNEKKKRSSKNLIMMK